NGMQLEALGFVVTFYIPERHHDADGTDGRTDVVVGDNAIAGRRGPVSGRARHVYGCDDRFAVFARKLDCLLNRRNGVDGPAARIDINYDGRYISVYRGGIDCSCYFF